MTFVVLLVGCFAVGYLAQSQKGRAGFLWGMGTFFLALPWWFVVGIISATARHGGGLDGVSDGAVGFTQAVFVTVPPVLIVGLGVLTLPAKRTDRTAD